jgi:hypothetical protein
MYFTKTLLAALAASGATAAPSQDRNDVHDITVQLTGPGVPTWNAVGFSATQALEATSARNPGPFTQVRVTFSDKIKREVHDIEKNYRCALEDKDGNRIVVTRGENIDFNFGDGGNPNAWTLKDGPIGNVKVKCDPNFKKVEKADVNAVRVTLTNSANGRERNLEFVGHEQTQATTKTAGAPYTNVQLFVGPGVANQKLRCQLKAQDQNIILVDRGQNKNKKTFGDGGKGAWALDVAGDGIARVETVTCDPNFKNE